MPKLNLDSIDDIVYLMLAYRNAQVEQQKANRPDLKQMAATKVSRAQGELDVWLKAFIHEKSVTVSEANAAKAAHDKPQEQKDPNPDFGPPEAVKILRTALASILKKKVITQAANTTPVGIAGYDEKLGLDYVIHIERVHAEEKLVATLAEIKELVKSQDKTFKFGNNEIIVQEEVWLVNKDKNGKLSLKVKGEWQVL